MYLEFFDFNKVPFHITPDPEFLFLSPGHKEALESISCAIEQRKGLIAITGEAGVGKTTILRSFVDGIDPQRIKVAYLFNVALSFSDLLKQMVSELEIPAADEESLEPVLFDYLRYEYEHGRRVALILDEAQNIPEETLDRLRQLADFETSSEKLLQIIFVGQPEFLKKLNQPELRQLKRLLGTRCRIDSLKPQESLAYIEHRLTKASSRKNPVFTKKALKGIVKESKGIPRLINILCDNALVTAFARQRNPVDDTIIREAISDLRGEQAGSSFRWRFAFISGLLVFSVLFGLVSKTLISSRKIPPISKETSSPQVSEFNPSTETVKEPDFITAPPTDIVHQDGNLQSASDKPVTVSTDPVRINILPSTEPGPPLPNASRDAQIFDPEMLSAKELIVLAKAQFSDNPARAEKLLRAATDSEPLNWEGYLELGRLLTFTGDYSGAVEQYEKALSINNRIPEIYFNLGYIYLKQKIYDRAREMYENCLASSPPYKDEVLTNLGFIELKTGNERTAKGLFLKALQFKPDNKLARKYLAKLGMANSGK